MKKTQLFTVALIVGLAVTACVKEAIKSHKVKASDTGLVRIALTRDFENNIKETRANAHLEDSELPPIDDFDIEIYNSNGIRLYYKPYKIAKEDTINLNAGKFRLVAQYGDSLGVGFSKAYFLADEQFTVHSFIDNGRKPDEVKAVASLGNVKIAVKFSSVFSKYYSDYYAVVRHEALPAKSIKFSKNEVRCGYIPGGNLYIEVYAKLDGSGMQSGSKEGYVYFKSQPLKYDPKDFVTFNLNTNERQGDLDLKIILDNSLEQKEYDQTIPYSAIVKDEPHFSFRGKAGDDFKCEYIAGTGKTAGDEIIGFSADAGLKTLNLKIESPYINGLESGIDVLSEDEDVKNKLSELGIIYSSDVIKRFGGLDLSSIADILSLKSKCGYSSATVTVSMSDALGRNAGAVLTFEGKPALSKLSYDNKDITTSRVKNITGAILNSDQISSKANLKLQYSLNEIEWNEIPFKSVNGNTLNFGELVGLQQNTQYKLRLICNDDENNVSELYTIKTALAEQVPNSDFEQYSELSFITDAKAAFLVGGAGKFEVKWWQLHDGVNKVWAVNSPISIVKRCTTVWYPDYKSFPTVSVTKTGAYSGSSLILASIAISHNASEVKNGNANTAKVFLGTSAETIEGEWEGKWSGNYTGYPFSSKPSALSFMYKFDCYSKDPFSVSIRLETNDKREVASGALNNVIESVWDWKECVIPLNYVADDILPEKIFIEFKSSATDNKNSRKVTIHTLSGAHTVHAGNILYLDNVSLKYD